MELPYHVKHKLSGDMCQKNHETNKPAEFGAWDIFKNSECRKATLAMLVIWMSATLSKPILRLLFQYI